MEDILRVQWSMSSVGPTVKHMEVITPQLNIRHMRNGNTK